MIPQRVLDKLELLPVQPGCYVFRGAEREVLYIGKAKSLRSRVRSYFQEGSSDTRSFLPLLRRTIDDLETIVVETEKEAAILENLLIKEHRPRFNIKLKDDKEFPLLRLDTAAEWPRLEVVRRTKQDKAKYFGPFPSASNARKALHLVNRHFQLRTCTDTEMASRRRPCLQYQIKRCPAPCVYEVDHDRYGTQVRAVALFLDGRHDELTAELQGKMRDAAKGMDFETAAVYRDQIRAVGGVQETQRVVGDRDVDQDVIGLHREADLVEISVVYVRKGCIRDTGAFSLTDVEIPDDEVIAAFLRQGYDVESTSARVLPDEIIVPVLPEGADGVAEVLTERRGKKVQILRPQRGKKLDLLALAQQNAAHAFREKRRENEDIVERLGKVQQRLRLPRLPRRIECVDISHHAGDDAVGAVVALLDGKPNKSRYRVFRVRTAAAGDDYAAMYEVLARRFKRGRDVRTLLAAERPANVWPNPEGGTVGPDGIYEDERAEIEARAAAKALAAGSLASLPASTTDLVAAGAVIDDAVTDGAETDEFELPEQDDEDDEIELEFTPTPVDVDVTEALIGADDVTAVAGVDPAALRPIPGEDHESPEPEPTHDPVHHEAGGLVPVVRDADNAREASAASPFPPSNARIAKNAKAAKLVGSSRANKPNTPAKPGRSSLEPTVSSLPELPPGDPWDLPDLLVVDGGRGQLRVALTAARDLGLHDLPIVGLAKERENTKGENLVDRVYLPGQKNGIPLRSSSPALFFLARARDEAHRASNRAREQLAKARVLRSELDDVPGIGPKSRNALLAKLGSVDGVKKASDADLLEIPGITTRMVRALRKHWPSSPP